MDQPGIERRFQRPDGEDAVVVCRVCWDRVPLRPEGVELADGRAYYRCPSCGGSFLIRWVDAVGLGVTEPRDTPA